MVLVDYSSGNGTTPGRNREDRKVAGPSLDGTTSRVRAGDGRVCFVCNIMFAVFAHQNTITSDSGGAEEELMSCRMKLGSESDSKDKLDVSGGSSRRMMTLQGTCWCTSGTAVWNRLL